MGKLDEKRASILQSATEVFSKKGFAEATISDIARGAGITDSGVYHYFRGKEDILFTIPEDEMNVFLSNAQEQIEGIKGAENKLRKLIWYHCKYFTTKKEYTRLLLLECRSNTSFYSSKAYKSIKDYSRIIISILEEGIKEGVIQEQTNLRLLRDMIMGCIDHAALNWVLRDSPSPLEKAEVLHELIMNSCRSPQRNKPQQDSKHIKKKRIIDVATKIFAEKRYNATVSQIAKKAGVAEGTIYEYYQSKESLLVSIPEEKLRELIEYIEERSPEKRLERVILFCLRFFNNNRDFTSILVLMLRPNSRFYDSKSYQMLDKISDNIGSLVVEGMREKVFLEDIDVDTYLDLVFGTIDHITIPWVIFEREYDLLQVGEEASKLFVNAIRS
jgi:TetR/AcrR family fatty acid metabolism transcriptional regulator